MNLLAPSWPIIIAILLHLLTELTSYFRTGLYPSKKPEILGRECAGYAMTTSSVNPHIKQGQRVVWMGAGGYAEYSAVPAGVVAAVPDHISLSTACAAYIQGLTAVTLIEESHHVLKGDWVLVPAAAGGVGGLLCQLLRARGAHTIATASTEAKRKLALEYGADVAVPYEQTLDAVKEHTTGKGVVASFDGVGQSTFDQGLQALARKGTMVSFGNASGAVEPFRIARLSEKNNKLCRPTLFNYLKEPEEVGRYSKVLWDVVGKEDGKGGPGRIRVEVYKTYPLSEIKQAHTVSWTSVSMLCVLD
jgi:NADPH:quinone reductase-like Zn-dependent oxidoreductase